MTSNKIPRRVIDSLLNRYGVTPETIANFQLRWNGQALTIPIFGLDGRCIAHKTVRWLSESAELEPVALHEPGEAELYGREHLTARRKSYIFICDGELNRLALESKGIRAVTGTAGAAIFLEDWAIALSKFNSAFVNDQRPSAGIQNAKDG